MPWEALEHTADAGVVVTAGDRETLFAEALRALTDCITEVERVRPDEHRRVRLSGDNVELLLVEWLGEAVYRFDVEGFVVAGARVEISEASGGGLMLRGEMAGELYDPDRHPHKVAIKAVTYHGLEVAATGDGWRAKVIFDI
ncbi:MAG: archease [Thermoanaerobaculia bacterium]